MKKIAVFDVCFTMYNCNTTVEFFKFIKNKYFIRYYLFILFNRICIFLKLYSFFDKNRFMFLSGLDKNILKLELSKYYKNVLNNNINNNIFEKINFYKKNNYEIYLISASMELVISQIAKELGIINYYGTKLIEKDGLFTGFILSDLLTKNSKERILLNKININNDIDFKLSVAFSDSIDDLKQWKKIENRFLVSKNNITEYDE